MRLGEFDRSGRRKPVPIQGSEFTLAVDTVVPAISQNTDASFIPTGSDVTLDKWGGIKKTGKAKNRTTAENVFIAGDAASGPATVVEAIAMGHKTAADIDGFIRAKNNEPPYKMPPEEVIEIPFEVDEEVVETPRGKMPELKKSECRTTFKEVELGYSKKTAYKEACRCLRCDADCRATGREHYNVSIRASRQRACEGGPWG
jgi:NADPH-dependent glutamate synthase beta subunit-like oxidoreductase